MQYEKGDWYDQHIEDPLKGIVRYLRNNGINTECSCGHEMWIQCHSHLGYGVPELHKLIWVYLTEHPGKLGYDGINFSIVVEHTVMDGFAHTTMMLYLPKKRRSMRGWSWPRRDKESGNDGYQELRQMWWEP